MRCAKFPLMLQFQTSINHKHDINIDGSLSFFREFILQKAVIYFSQSLLKLIKFSCNCP